MYTGFPSSIIVSAKVTSIAKMSPEYINIEVNDIMILLCVRFIKVPLTWSFPKEDCNCITFV